jgi:hypothetical protein
MRMRSPSIVTGFIEYAAKGECKANTEETWARLAKSAPVLGPAAATIT